MKYIVAVKLHGVTELFEFRTKKDANGFIKDIKLKYRNIEYVITMAVV